LKISSGSETRACSFLVLIAEEDCNKMAAGEQHQQAHRQQQASSSSGRVGVADYFTILGVGKNLVWKHAQKKSSAETASASEEEDDAALLERFYREIVDVSILTATTATTDETDSHSQQQQQQLITVSSYTDNESISVVSRQHNNHYYAVSIPPSPSDLMSGVTGTEVESRPELHGLTILQQTRPAERGVENMWTKSQTFDANLDPVQGLSGELQALQDDLEEKLRRDANATPLKELRRKVLQSTLGLRHTSHKKSHGAPKFYLAFRRRQPDEGNRPAISHVELYYVRLHKSITTATLDKSSSSSHHYYHHPTTTTAPSTVHSSSGASATKSGVSGASSVTASSSIKGATAALMGRMAEAGKQVVRDRVTSGGGSRQQHPHHNSQHGQGPAGGDSSFNAEHSDILPLEDMIQLPKGFDEWSIPERYKFMRIPPSRPTSPFGDSRSRLSRTFLFPPTGDDATLSPGASGGVGVEAMAVESSSRRRDDDTVRGDASWEEMIQPKVVTEVKEVDDEFVYIPILAVKRQRIGDEERYHEDPGIVELAVSFCDHQGDAVLPEEIYDFDDENEGDAGAFSLLGKTPWSVSLHRQKDGGNVAQPTHDVTPQQRLGTTAILIRRNVPLGFCDAAFATRVLDRFPFRNYKGLPLPEEELPMFCYPTGCRLHRARFSDAPLAQYYGFVVKNERGDSIYVSCVSFMEPLTRDKVHQLAAMSHKRRRVSLPHRGFCEQRRRTAKQHGDEDGSITVSDIKTDDDVLSTNYDEDTNFLLTGFDDMTTFENKTICLVGRYPFWTAFRRFLSHLHILSGSSSDLPLERCISHLLLSVPVPKPNGPIILIPLPTLNLPMVLSSPPLKDLPLVDLPFERLVSCLDIPTVVTVVLGFLALERKVCFLSVGGPICCEREASGLLVFLVFFIGHCHVDTSISCPRCVRAVKIVIIPV
jgi:hypothetical protein